MHTCGPQTTFLCSVGSNRDKNAGLPPPLGLQLSFPHPATEREHGVFYSFTAGPSCGIWAAQDSPLRTLIQIWER